MHALALLFAGLGVMCILMSLYIDYRLDQPEQDQYYQGDADLYQVAAFALIFLALAVDALHWLAHWVIRLLN